jgi:hypothetical protein
MSPKMPRGVVAAALIISGTLLIPSFAAELTGKIMCFGLPLCVMPTRKSIGFNLIVENNLVPNPFHVFPEYLLPAPIVELSSTAVRNVQRSPERELSSVIFGRLGLTFESIALASPAMDFSRLRRAVGNFQSSAMTFQKKLCRRFLDEPCSDAIILVIARALIHNWETL